MSKFGSSSLGVVAIAMATLLAAACSPQGSAEKAGQGADSAIEETTQGQRNLGDGPLEEAGEAVDRTGDAVEREAKEAAPQN